MPAAADRQPPPGSGTDPGPVDGEPDARPVTPAHGTGDAAGGPAAPAPPVEEAAPRPSHVPGPVPPEARAAVPSAEARAAVPSAEARAAVPSAEARAAPAGGAAPADGTTPAAAAAPAAGGGAVLDQELLEHVGEDSDVEELATFGRLRQGLIAVVASVWVGWQLWIAATIPLAPTRMRSVHLAFALVLVFLMYPTTRLIRNRHVRLVVDLVLGAAGAASMLHLYRTFANPDFRRVIDPLPIDHVLGWVAIAIVLLGCLRATGKPLAVTGLLALAYALWGDYLPGPAGHGGFSVERVLSFLYIRVEGLLGTAVGASATTIFPVLIFGALLISMGGGVFIAEVATALLSRIQGATAKITVLASGLFAMVSGSGAANVASTGVFTIPLMRRQGFSRTFSAGTESAAAIGGQITPPIMGASAFVMAEFLNVSYATIVRHALIPAGLFYAMVFITVHFGAKKEGVGPLTGDVPSVWTVLRGGWHFILPLALLLWTLAVQGQSVAKGAFQATVLLLVLDLGRRLLARRPLELRRVLAGVLAGAKSGLIVATATAAVQVLMAVVGLTGIGIKLSSLMVSLAGGSLISLLLLTMFASLLLGTGLPTVPTYLILAILTAPALTEFGVPLIAAHFFVLYFGVMSDLTPPTALGPTIAAGIADAPLLRTMFAALRLGLAGFILPFMFVYRPALMLEGGAGEIVFAVLIALAAVLLIAIGLNGFMYRRLSAVEQAGFLVAGALLVLPDVPTTIAGLVLGAILLARQLAARRGGPRSPRAVGAPAAA
jgi:TRAP transporter 4TM/12TM fusion protein